MSRKLKKEQPFILLASEPMMTLARSIEAELHALNNHRFRLETLRFRRFDNSELVTNELPNMRGKWVYVLIETQYPDVPVCSSRLHAVLDAVNRSGAIGITAVLPSMAWNRGDRATKKRECIMAVRQAQFLETFGLLRQIITMELHDPHIAAYYRDIEVIDLPGCLVTAPEMRPWTLDRNDPLVVLAPDVGAIKRMPITLKLLGRHVILCGINKHRPEDNTVEIVHFIGNEADLEGRRVAIIDDLIDTSGSVVASANYAIDHGAREVVLSIIHPVLSAHTDKASGEWTTAEEKLRRAGVKSIFAHTIPRDTAWEQANTHIRLLNPAAVFARAMHATTTPDQSVSELYDAERRIAKNLVYT